MSILKILSNLCAASALSLVACASSGVDPAGEPEIDRALEPLSAAAPSTAAATASGSTGSADILWRDTSGTVDLWLMNGAVIVSQHFHSTPGTGWVIAGVGDFNGDGHSDIFWRDTIQGTLQIWFMNGGELDSANFLAGPGPEWAVQGVGDFDGDGHSDILWRAVADGQVDIWFMNGIDKIGEALPGGKDPSHVWSIQGVGDFDRDGHSDILWRGTNGALTIWFMNGGEITAQPATPAPGPEWAIQGVGDFDDDGTSDILWRAASDGQVDIWFMDGITRVGEAFPVGKDPSHVWSIQGVGDFDHDGHSDILWRGTDGTVRIWFMNAGAIVRQRFISNPGSIWAIQGVGRFD
jgi:hypothetical protein